MKATTIEEAKGLAKGKSLETQYKDEAIHIIYCNRTKLYYVDTNSFVRNWEQLIGYYINGIYNAEKSHS